MIFVEFIGGIGMFALSMFVLLVAVALISETGDRRTTGGEAKKDGKSASIMIVDELDRPKGNAEAYDDVCDACGINPKQQNSLICKECEEKINENK